MDALLSILDSIKKSIPPVHPAGWPFIATFAVAAVLLSLLWEPLGWVGLVATVWCFYFFRNPVRNVPQINGAVVSPADGVVSDISVVNGPAELDMDGKKYLRVSIFLNVFNVHVNRVPIGGKIKRLFYVPGKFLNATLDKASDENERQLCLVKTEDGTEIGFVQIAGLIARRIICDLEDGEAVSTGDRFGLIRFGSRMDVYLPEKTQVMVAVGHTMVGGETLIATLKGRTKYSFEAI